MNAEAQLKLFNVLIALENAAREAPDRRALALLLANDLQTVLPCGRVSVLQRNPRGGWRLTSASGVPEISRYSPFGLWVEQLAVHLNPPPGHPDSPLREVVWDDLPESLRDPGREFHLGTLLWYPMVTGEASTKTALLLQKEGTWSDAEKVLAGHLARSLGHAVASLEQRCGPSMASRLFRPWHRWLGVTALVLAGLLPINITALAPAEVIPLDPALVTAPMDGVVQTIAVEPYSPVQQGDALFSLDAATLTSEQAIARQELALARAKLRRAEQDSFRDNRSKGERAILEEESALQAARLAATDERLARITTRAFRDGVVLFNDADDWLGRPVKTGQEVMSLADPTRVACRILLPVQDAIVLTPGSPVRLFLDSDPLHPLSARLIYAAYQAEITPQGYAAFRLEAHFEADATRSLPRIGLRGTARLQGEQVTLGYYLLRRPLAAMRQFIGL